MNLAMIDTWVVPAIHQGWTLGHHSPPTLILDVISSTSPSQTIHTSDSSIALVKPGFAPELYIQISKHLFELTACVFSTTDL